MKVFMCRQSTALALLLVAAVVGVSAKYEVKDLQLRPADQYGAHQSFQSIVIGAYACNTKAKTLEIFDTDKLHKNGILPVVLVIENHNEFPIRLREAEIYLINGEGASQRTIPFIDVLLEISLKNPLSYKSGQKELTVEKAVNKDMRLDFEHKSFGEKLIGPSSSDYGVVFFRLPRNGALEGYRLYFPEVTNVVTEDPLIFFEFSLLGTGE